MTDVQWRETVPGRVTIGQAPPRAGRLFGLPFLAVGGYFLALAFARRVSEFLGVDVQDRCIEGGEVTAGGVVVTRVEDAD